ncbi:LytTR family transcriptional regulator [Lacihabitans sp. LS3-19]|uniref:LytTR family DNA-binding domain-containing protein n=1 Tax=Lacihabitans sp. LS3-19 TaxID=2487335 RepID=UPI0020CD639D|nr:LytTR family DNA-binding domain-containing protein [Lacihabitans sp. LS3-19]MCP9770006.1 LytTR family transcriptional regulator [Lacihabitans sp. LS3-19]
MKYKFENVRAIQKAEISPQDIILIKADFNYTVFHLKNGKKLTLAKTLLECEQMLESYGFLRPSRSVLINLSFLKTINDSEVVMVNDFISPVSRRRKMNVLSIIKQK